LLNVVSKFGLPRRWLRIASYFVLSLLAVEITLLVTIGAVRSRELLGFYTAHLALFFPLSAESCECIGSASKARRHELVGGWRNLHDAGVLLGADPIQPAGSSLWD